MLNTITSDPVFGNFTWDVRLLSSVIVIGYCHPVIVIRYLLVMHM